MAAPKAAVQPLRWWQFDLLDNRYPSLHGLRTIAIVSVVQIHVTSVMLRPDDGLGFFHASRSIFFGMDLFFILSGFLIGSILLRSRDRDHVQRLRRFYLRRIFRTVPPYFVVLTFLALTKPLTAAQRHNLPYEFLYARNFLMTQSIGNYVMPWGWSLAVEEQFYLVVPLLFFALQALRSAWASIGFLLLLWISAFVLRLVLLLNWPWPDLPIEPTLYTSTLTRFDTLAAGILLAFVEFRWSDEIARWLTRPLHRWVLGIVSLACVVLLMQWPAFGNTEVRILDILGWGTITSVMYFGALLLLLHGDGWVHRALSAGFFRRLATLGYGVYLVHLPVIRAFAPQIDALRQRHVPVGVMWAVGLTIAMIGSLAIAYVMHIVIEKPAMRLRDRFAG